MGRHNIGDELRYGGGFNLDADSLYKAMDLYDGSGGTVGASIGYLMVAGDTAPSSVAGYAPGCLFLDIDTGTVSANTGSVTSCTFTQLDTTSSSTLDGAYNADTGERTVTVDDGSVVLDLDADHALVVNNSTSGTVAAGLVVDAEDASSVFTDAISLITTAGAITDGVDASDAGITNAINVGGNVILGTTATINFTNFDVAGATGNTVIGGTLTVSGTQNVGSDGSAADMNFYANSAGDLMMWDGSESTLLFTDSHIHLQDSDELHFGAGSATASGDWKVYSDGTHLYVAAGADVANQALYLGDDTNDVDVIWEGDTNAAIFQMDSSLNQVTLNGCTLRMQDSDQIQLGTGASNNGDWKVYSDGADLFVAAVANTAGATLYLGDDTNHVDVVWEGTTNGDVVLFDHDNDQISLTDVGIVIAESGNEESLDITGNGATSVSVVEVNSSAVIANDKGLISCLSSGNLASGGTIARLAAAGTPVAGAMGLEVVGAGKELIGIYSDVDSTGDAYTLHCGGATGAADAVLLVSSDGTPAAADSSILEVLFTGDDANEPILCNIAGTGSGVNSGGVYVATESDGTSCWHLNLVDAKDDAVGVVARSYQNSATEAAGDAVFTWKFYGNDDAGTPNVTEYARLEAEIMTVTDGQEDGKFVFSAAADNGTMTEMFTASPRAGGSVPELAVGPAAGGRITTGSAHSLYLDTNRGTTSAAIELESGTNSDVIVTLQGTGEFKLATAGDITTVSTVDLILDTNEGTNSGTITIANGANNDITLVPNGTGLVIPQALGYTCTAKTTTATLTEAEGGFVDVKSAGGAYSLTLPAVSGNAGLWYTFKKTDADANAVTLDADGTETIDGNLTVADIDADNDTITILCDGTEWHIVQRWIH